MRAETDDPNLANIQVGGFVYTAVWRTGINPEGTDFDRYIVTKLTPKGFWACHDNHRFGNRSYSESTDTVRELRPMSWNTDVWVSFTGTRKYRTTEGLAIARLVERTKNYIDILEKRVEKIKTRKYMLDLGVYVSSPKSIFDSDY